MNTNKGATIYYLDRNTHNISSAEDSIVTMKIEEKDGKRVAVGKVHGTFTIRFGVDEIKELNKRRPTIFGTMEEAIAQHTKERQASIDYVLNLSKEELIKELFNEWNNPESGDDYNVVQAMKEKIKEELGVDV